MKFRRSLLLGLLLILLFLPSQLLACACCADDGYYSISYAKPDQFLIAEIGLLKPQTAVLYSEPGEDENPNGLKSDSENFRVSGEFKSSVWKLSLTDEENKTGSIELTVPEKMISFSVDLHDGRKGGGGGPLLYKEWRFKAKVKSRTGIFKPRIASNADYFLVFQGRGNACPNASDFTHWRIEVSGKDAKYALFGELAQQNQPETEPLSSLLFQIDPNDSQRFKIADVPTDFSLFTRLS